MRKRRQYKNTNRNKTLIIFFKAEDGIRYGTVTGVQTCALPISGMRIQQFGLIISISSVVAQTGVAGTAAYAASKAGLLGLTKTVAKETATSGITANALALGYFDTGMITEVSPELKEQIRLQIPKQRLG